MEFACARPDSGVQTVQTSCVRFRTVRGTVHARMLHAFVIADIVALDASLRQAYLQTSVAQGIAVRMVSVSMLRAIVTTNGRALIARSKNFARMVARGMGAATTGRALVILDG